MRWEGTDKHKIHVKGGDRLTQNISNGKEQTNTKYMITSFRVEYIQQENLYGLMGGWVYM